jgi:hypothetical protein
MSMWCTVACSDRDSTLMSFMARSGSLIAVHRYSSSSRVSCGGRMASISITDVSSAAAAGRAAAASRSSSASAQAAGSGWARIIGMLI